MPTYFPPTLYILILPSIYTYVFQVTSLLQVLLQPLYTLLSPLMCVSRPVHLTPIYSIILIKVNEEPNHKVPHLQFIICSLILTE